MKSVRILRVGLLAIVAITIFGFLSSTQVNAQRSKRSRGAKVCGDPTVPCKTTATFEVYDLPFQIPANATIWESEQFYAIILKSVSAPDENCDIFIPESDRLEAQAMFPKMKVFSSRCTMAGSIYYSNVASNQQFMAVFVGTTKAMADRMLATVKQTGKFPSANIRRMRAGFNGT